MKFAVAELICRVLELLDENEALIGERMEYGEAGADLRDLIRRVLPDIARSVLLSAPAHLIDDCRHIDTKPVPTPCGEGLHQLRLPGGFLRLICFRMNRWPRGVKTPMEWGGEAHQVSSLNLTGRPGKAPAMALNMMGDRSQLEIFGAETGDFVAQFDYLEDPCIVDGYMELPPRIVAEICDKTAEKLTLIFKNFN